MDEWMDEAFRRAWMNYANKSLLDMGFPLISPRSQGDFSLFLESPRRKE